MRCGSYQNNNKRTNEFFFSFLILLGMYTPAQKVWSAGSWLFFFWRRKKGCCVCVCKFVYTHHARTPNDYRRPSSTAICRHSRIIDKKKKKISIRIKKKFPAGRL
jgi:hypothetical protein